MSEQQGPAITADEQAEAARAAIAQLEGWLKRTPRTERRDRAVLRYNLGLAYQELPVGDRNINLARSVSSLREATKLFDRGSEPIEHARALNALGAALRELRQPEEAIGAFQEAVSLVPIGVNPGEHGAALNNLGLALADVGRAEEAADAFEGALEAFAGPDGVRQRISTLHNLGQLLSNASERATIERGIERLAEALSLADPQEHPYQWAMVHHSMGVAYTALGDGAAAVESLRQAGRVFTRPRFPFQYALTKNNLGLAYAQIGDIESLRRAVVAYEDALRVLDVRLHREQWEQVYRNLELAESALSDADAAGTRPENFVALAAVVAPEERIGLMRDRLSELAELPEPRRTDAFAEIDHAILSLDHDASKAVTAAWLDTLMELPQEHFEAGLRARMSAQGSLDPAAKERASEILDRVIQEELLAPQRIRVRDTLYALGYDRAEGGA